MTSNEETIRKFAEAFDEAFGDECKAAYITVVPELGKGPLLDDLAKLFACNRPVGQRRQRLHAGHVHHRRRRPGILERTPSWQRKMTRTLFRTRSYPTR